MTFTPYVFVKLETAKDVLSEMSKKADLRTTFDSQHAKGFQTLLKSAAQHFYRIFLL